MSNPAVIKLQSGKIGRSKFWMDDNFGESIHIHLDDFRVDLTVDEFRNLYEDICTALTKLIDIENFDARKLDPVFLSQWLWPKLSKLERVTYDKVKLGELIGPYNFKKYKLPESVGVKLLQGISNEAEGFRKSHHIGQTEADRMKAMMDSIKEHGYPYNDNYIVLYGDDNIIRDGQHRASCLFVLYGNIEVPVLRMYFKDYRSPKINKFTNSSVMSFYKKQRKHLSRLKNYILPFAKKAKKASSVLLKRPVSRTKVKVAINSDLERLFASK